MKKKYLKTVSCEENDRRTKQKGVERALSRGLVATVPKMTGDSCDAAAPAGNEALYPLPPDAPKSGIHHVFSSPDTPKSGIHHVFSFPDTPAKKIHHVFSFPDTPAKKIHYVFSFPDTPAKKIHDVFEKNNSLIYQS
ncbi:MAG: hypothetical protein LBS03_02430 [Bacteroidales bacterium]|jgi:hypothetical protein|nr:hypothetical protein [Bacteroidales bacterium]